MKSIAPPPPFHLAIPVHSLSLARHFYKDQLGCSEGRSTNTWVDFNFFGHQLVCHLSSTTTDQVSNTVDGMNVPIPHFGVVINESLWQSLIKQLDQAGVDYKQPPSERFQGKPGQQKTLFIQDPSGNTLEFKCLANAEELFQQ